MEDWLSISNPRHTCTFIQHTEWIAILLLLSIFSLYNDGIYPLLSDYVTVVWLLDLVFFVLAWFGFFWESVRTFVLRWIYLFVHGSTWIVITLSVLVLLYNSIAEPDTKIEISWHFLLHILLHILPLLALYIYLEPTHGALRKALANPPKNWSTLVWCIYQTFTPLVVLLFYRLFTDPHVEYNSSLPEWLAWIVAVLVCISVNGTRVVIAIWKARHKQRLNVQNSDPNLLYI